jgi:hypothetical protein
MEHEMDTAESPLDERDERAAEWLEDMYAAELLDTPADGLNRARWGHD